MTKTKYLQVNKLVTAGWLAVVGTIGCSTGPKLEAGGSLPAEQGPQPATLSKVESAIVSNCRLSTVGLPCDPDGAGDASECEGVCWIDDAALVACLPVSQVNMIVTDLNGRICGDVEGRNCGRSCENGACVDKNARLGTACRPNNNSSTCEGVCTLVAGEPTCDEVTVCSNVGISDDGCVLTACNFDTYEEATCKDYALENSVCEASQVPVIEAGVSNEPADAAVADAGDAAANSADAASSQVDAAADETTAGLETTAAQAGDAAASSNDAGSASADPGDGGSLPHYSNPAAKVVGGACTLARPGTNVGLEASSFAVALAAVGLVFARRRRVSS